jgi:lysine 6-dehydrogenase
MAGLICMPDCGLAPGLISSFIKIKNAHSLNGYAQSVDIYCGGIPLIPEPPLSYIEVFSPKGVINEYTGVAFKKLNNKIIEIPALSDTEWVYTNRFGMLEASSTSGGLSNTLNYTNIPNVSYKTLRWPGHFSYVKEHIMTQEDPIQTLKSQIKLVSCDNQDIVILIFKFTFIDAAAFTLSFYWTYDTTFNISAMAQATGYTVGIVANMIFHNKISPGVKGMHSIYHQDIISQAKKIDNKQYSFLD